VTAELDIRSAQTLSVADRAKLFTAAYEGYVVPMHIDEAALAWMQEKFDFDLDASRIAFLEGEPVGLANLAVRGPDAWVGGIGVVPAARRTGAGEALMRALHEEARGVA
jgi:GNAT superfamily N-acetyltransferase